MIIGGFQKFSMIDYPDKLSAVIFTQGCNFRCSYCHNPELIPLITPEDRIPVIEVISFLERRKNQLEAVTITGGEPALQMDLVEFIKRIKEIGYLVKLDTNGSFPDLIKYLINQNLVNYIAMDIKAPLDKYTKITDSNVYIDKIQDSIDLLMNSEIDYEFRTTIAKPLLDEQDIIDISKMIKGANKLVLQKYTPSKSLIKSCLNQDNYSEEELKNFKNIAIKEVQNCIVR